jgi:hypothetical protein
MPRPQVRTTLLLPCLLAAAIAAASPGIVSIGAPLSGLDRGDHDCKMMEKQVVCQRSGTEIRYRGLGALAMTLEYEEELLRRVTVLFDEAQFAEVEHRLDADFGTGEAHDEKLRTGMAGAIVNRIRVWRAGGETLMFEQFSGRISTSALHVLSEADFETEMRRREASRVRGMRDL